MYATIKNNLKKSNKVNLASTCIHINPKYPGSLLHIYLTFNLLINGIDFHWPLTLPMFLNCHLSKIRVYSCTVYQQLSRASKTEVNVGMHEHALYTNNIFCSFLIWDEKIGCTCNCGGREKKSSASPFFCYKYIVHDLPCILK